MHALRMKASQIPAINPASRLASLASAHPRVSYIRSLVSGMPFIVSVRYRQGPVKRSLSMYLMCHRSLTLMPRIDYITYSMLTAVLPPPRGSCLSLALINALGTLIRCPSDHVLARFTLFRYSGSLLRGQNLWPPDIQ